MKRLIISGLAAVGMAATVSVAKAADFSPAIVFDMGGKFDKSFNQAAYDGAERFMKSSGVKYREFEVTSPAQREQAIRNMARRGATSSSALALPNKPVSRKSRKEFPDTSFAIIDAVVDLPNVRSIVFKEHEGSFLVGMAAALASKTGKGRLRRRHGHPAHPQLRRRL